MYPLRNQQTCISNNHNQIKGGLIFNPIFCDLFYRRFVDATRVFVVEMKFVEVIEHEKQTK